MSDEAKKESTSIFQKPSFWFQLVGGLLIAAGGYHARDVLEQLRDHDRRITVNGAEVRAIGRELTQLEKLLNGVEARLKIIEGNRFIDEQGSVLRDDIAKIWVELSQIKGRLPSKFPPPATERRIEKVEDRLLDLERRVPK